MKTSVLKEKLLSRAAELIDLVNEAAVLKRELHRMMREMSKLEESIESLEASYVEAVEAEDEDAEPITGSFVEGLSEENITISDSLEEDDIQTFTPKQKDRALSRAWAYFVQD